jgi:hypothetical protein
LTHEFVVFEVADDLLSKCLGTFLKVGNLIGGKLLLDSLHVALREFQRRQLTILWKAMYLEVGEIVLFGESGGLETEGVDNVVDLGSAVL